MYFEFTVSFLGLLTMRKCGGIHDIPFDDLDRSQYVTPNIFYGKNGIAYW